MDMRDEIRKLQELMEAADYVTDAPIATSVYLAMRLQKPLLIEGPAGVGKTEVAKVMARMLGTNLIRLQCYEGLDASTALYEWNYQKQLLHIKLEEAGHNNRAMDERSTRSSPSLSCCGAHSSRRSRRTLSRPCCWSTNVIGA